MERRIRDLSELKAFAAGFVGAFSRGQKAVVVALSGDLGAGKTTFTQNVAQLLGVEEDVTSPTFVIEKIYLLKGQRFERLIHIDAYRLENPRELEVLGFAGLLEDPDNLILIEWPEKVAQLIPKDAIKIRFDIHGDERTISIDGQEKDGN